MGFYEILLIIIVIGLFIGLFTLLNKTTIKQKNKIETKNLENQQILKQREKELGIDYIYNSGKYIAGHPSIDQAKENTAICFNKTELLIVNDNVQLRIYGKIPLNSIKKIDVEDASTFKKRVTATRLIALGIFALAAKKKEVVIKYYLTINWNDGRFDNETMFEFIGNGNLLNNVNSLKNEIQNRCHKAADNE